MCDYAAIRFNKSSSETLNNLKRRSGKRILIGLIIFPK